MTIKLEARKLSIIEYLAEVEDESIIQQIENLLKPDIDFWDTLSTAAKESIQRGTEQLIQEQRISYTEFISKYPSVNQ